MMSDLISRQAVLDKFKSLCDVCGDGEKYNGVMCRCCRLDDGICIVEDMPSAEPERKHGEWLPHPHEREWDVCSVCGIGCKRREYEMQFGQEKFSEYSYQYCPNCGARLEWKHENL